MKISQIFKDKRGESTPLIVAIVLSVLLICCAMSEFFRLGIIVQGVRDSLQSAVISVATTNYDEVYNGLREGYSGGYKLSGSSWQANLDYSDVYGKMDSILGTMKEGSYHVKKLPKGYEYRYYALDMDITNSPLAPVNANKNFAADVRVQIEIPLSFGWDNLPPLKMEVRTKAAYMPKF